MAISATYGNPRVMWQQAEARAAIRRETLTEEMLALPDLLGALMQRVGNIAGRLDTPGASATSPRGSTP